jgi:RNA recognition motif-containing protein
MKELFVSNIPFTYKKPDLIELFSEFGTVIEAKVIYNKVTRKSKGFGFVTLDSQQAAQNAIDSLNHICVNGRKLNIKEARPMLDQQTPAQIQRAKINIE